VQKRIVEVAVALVAVVWVTVVQVAVVLILRSVVLKFSWAVVSFMFNWRMLNISWHLGNAISRQSYLVKASAHGPKRGPGPRLRNPELDDETPIGVILTLRNASDALCW